MIESNLRVFVKVVDKATPALWDITDKMAVLWNQPLPPGYWNRELRRRLAASWTYRTLAVLHLWGR